MNTSKAIQSAESYRNLNEKENEKNFCV